jgi:prephenate dehydrogenase
MNAKCLTIGECFPETRQFWEEMGFSLEDIDAGEHDEKIGKLSHVSHYMIMKYVEFVDATMTEDDKKLAGSSYEKFKKMAEGAKRLKDIYDSNQKLPEIIEEFSEFMKK